MKFGKRLKIAFDMCRSEKGKFLLGILTVLIALFMVEIVLLLNANNNVYSKRIEKGIRYDIEDVYYINANGGRDRTVMEEIRKISGVYAMGNVHWGVANGSKAIRFLHDIQKGHQKFIIHEDYNSGRMIETYVFTDGFWDIGNIKLSSGKEPSEYEFNDNTVLLYLSEEYKEVVNIGEHYYDIHKSGVVVYDYVIAGFIDDGSTIIAGDAGTNTESLVSSGYYSMDYAIIEVNDIELFQTYICFDHDNEDTIKSEITEICDKYDIGVDIYSLKSVIRHAKDVNDEISGILLEISLLLFVVSLVFLITVQCGKIIMKAGDYGMWLVNGMTIKDIKIIILYQNMISMAIPLIVSLGAGYWYAMHEFGRVLDTGTMITGIYLRNIIPAMTGITVALVAIVTIVPLIILRKKTASEILKGDL